MTLDILMWPLTLDILISFIVIGSFILKVLKFGDEGT